MKIHKMSLLDLPNELLFEIAENLQHPKDLSSLIRANHRLANLLTSRLHSRAVQDKNGVNALQWAAQRGHEYLIELLLKKGFDIDFQGPLYQTGTALYRAVGARKEDVVRLLLSNGAAVNLPDAWGYTPLHVSATQQSDQIMRLLLEKGADHAASAIDGKTALHLAALENQEATARLLLEKGADPDIADDTRVRASPLFLAISGCKPVSLAVISLLLDNGADDAKRGRNWWEALGLAVRMGIESVVELILGRCIDDAGRFEVLDYALVNGAMTALHIAARAGYGAVVKGLLEMKGIDVDFNLTFEDHQGRTALDVAIAEACPSLRHTQELTTGLLKPINSDYRKTIDLLMHKSGLGVYKTKTLNQVLVWATEKGHEDVFHLLLENGADISTRRFIFPKHPLAWDTLLHVAVEFGHASLIRSLVEKGADINAINSNGDIPLKFYHDKCGNIPLQENILKMLGGEGKCS